MTKSVIAKPANLTIQVETIRPSTEAKYLGVTLDRHLLFNIHLQHTIDNACIRSNLLRAVSSRGKAASQETILHLYKTFVRPVIECAAAAITALHHTKVLELEFIERKILRNALQFLQCTHRTTTCEQSGIEHLLSRLSRTSCNTAKRQHQYQQDLFECVRVARTRKRQYSYE